MYQQNPTPKRVLIQHQTKYKYGQPVYLSSHLLRLKPAAHSRTAIETYSLLIKPENHVIHWQQDPFGNFLARVDFIGPVTELVIDVKLIARITPVNPFDFFIDDYAQYFPFEYESSLKKDLTSFLEITDEGPKLSAWVENTDRSKKGIIDFLVMMNQQVNRQIAYTERLQPGVQTSEESLDKALGSCRDSAWLLVQLLRHLGLAARFVSGYLIQLAEVKNGIDPYASEPDVAALHAWCEVYIPGAGWIGLDPTSGFLASEGHIPLACTPNAANAAPITGTSGVAETTFSFSNTVMRLS